MFAPQWQTYYRMLKVKIPVPAVRMKAMGAGEDMEEFEQFVKQLQKKFPGGSYPAHPLDGQDAGGGGGGGDDEDEDEDDDL